MTDQARAAYEARYQCDANDPMNANDLALFVAGYEAAVAAHETQSTLHNDWWRKRADEIEAAVAQTGSREAMSCYTEMRGLIQAVAAAPAQPAAALVGQYASDGEELLRLNAVEQRLNRIEIVAEQYQQNGCVNGDGTMDEIIDVLGARPTAAEKEGE